MDLVDSFDWLLCLIGLIGMFSGSIKPVKPIQQKKPRCSPRLCVLERSGRENRIWKPGAKSGEEKIRSWEERKSREQGAVNPQVGRRRAETQNSEPRTVNREAGKSVKRQ